MKIIVLMKQVANKDAVLRIAPDEKWINETDVAQQTNESDGYALEEALRVKEAKGEGEVIVCSLGSQMCEDGDQGTSLARGARPRDPCRHTIKRTNSPRFRWPRRLPTRSGRERGPCVCRPAV
jgi:hypothetical protein